jgi:LacI family transcriptional regulator
MANVSSSTVSNVLNKTKNVSQETEKRILQIINDTGYVPNVMAKNLKMKNTRIVGIIAEDIISFPTSDIINGICDLCIQEGYHTTLFNLRIAPMVSDFRYERYEKDERFKASIKQGVDQLLALNVCGIIYISIYPRNIEHILPSLHIPVTYCYAYSHSEDCCVNINDFNGAKMAVDYLISIGHKKIALLCGIFDTLPTHKRLIGYQTSLMEHSLPYIPQYIIQGAWTYEDGQRAFKLLMALDDPPTAVFSMNDMMAVGFINTAYENGLTIPEDISIHGFDDLEISRCLRPSLTTVSMPLVEMGRVSAKVLIDNVNSKSNECQKILLECKHVVRDSVSSPKVSSNIREEINKG